MLQAATPAAPSVRRSPDIFGKIGVTTRGGAALFAIEKGVI